MGQEITVSVPCENRYDILDTDEEEIEEGVEENEKESNTSVTNYQASRQRNNQRRKKGRYVREEKTWKQKEAALSEKDKRNKILLLGDSHGRGLTEKISDRLGSKFKVMSIVKPNALFDDVVMDIENLCSSYNKNDYVVIMGGTNDFSSSQGSLNLNLDKISRIADRTNIVMPGIPLRFDKVGFEVNNLILNFNLDLFRKIDNLKKENKNFVDMPRQKFSLKDHTTHGLHLNRHGKLKISNQIAFSISRHMKLNTLPHLTHSAQHTPIHTQNTLQLIHGTRHATKYSHSTPTHSAHSLTQSHTHFLAPSPQQALELSNQPEPIMSFLNSEVETKPIKT